MKAEDNELLVRTSVGTPMGELFRRYWIPALLAAELPEPDCPPVRVQLLSERLIAFRDSEGQLGLIDEFCAHRGVSLWFGRVEDGGIRCSYHGWKYATTGRCVEAPSEAVDTDYCRTIALKSYPLVQVGDVLWAYLGPVDQQPPLPEWEFATVPPEQTYISKRLQECNYLQAMEGGIDSSHVSFLHAHNLNADPLFKDTKGNQYNLSDKAPVFEVAESEGGLYIGARRNAESGEHYWRITPWVMPCFTMIPPRGDHPVHGHFWIPIDDEHCWAWSYDYHPVRALTSDERAAMEAGHGIHAKCVPGTYVPLASKANDYLMDRDAQKEGRTFSGIDGFAMQDAALQESMGAIQDRTKEHLVSTDNGIIMARHRLMRAAKQLAATGALPPGRDPAHQRVRSVAIVLPAGVPFTEGAREAFKAGEGVAPTSV